MAGRTVPDSVVRATGQVELVDMTAEALRRRMAHGNIYPPTTSVSGAATAPEALFMNIAWLHRLSAPTGP